MGNKTHINLSELVASAHTNAVLHGFWDKPSEVGTLLALIHSEISEALEAHRHGDKVNFAEELADTVIRIADLCGGYNIDLERAVLDKMAYNSKRPYKHGKNY